MMQSLKPAIVFLSLFLFSNSCDQRQHANEALKILTEIPELDITFIPEKYVAYKTEVPITVDGDLSDGEWGEVALDK